MIFRTNKKKVYVIIFELQVQIIVCDGIWAVSKKLSVIIFGLSKIYII